MLKIVMALAVGQSLGVRGLCAEVVLCICIMCNKIYFNVQGFILNQVQCLQLCLWFCEIDLVWWEASIVYTSVWVSYTSLQGYYLPLILSQQLAPQLAGAQIVPIATACSFNIFHVFTYFDADNYALNDTIIFFVNVCQEVKDNAVLSIHYIYIYI